MDNSVADGTFQGCNIEFDCFFSTQIGKYEKPLRNMLNSSEFASHKFPELFELLRDCASVWLSIVTNLSNKRLDQSPQSLEQRLLQTGYSR
ncbi:hypothetical protein TNIN_23221 [Trichonephila inaurata madagascariensis]|uniref:Uncharacterized protein n=1 Tax=Trichonephila inaurata madagascariensis TaxID=2747483 RepID=A0A8X6X596_9ARAC|nr:hypothetical protein TNIN_23221 [Trichonephila inaurata madagascariensis]